MTVPRPLPDSSAVGFVLAGGQSSRMGADKALIEFAGEPLVARALRILQQAGLEASIAGSRAPLAQLAPVVDDSPPHTGLGPLSGVCAALTASVAQHAVFLPVDTPLVPSSLIRYQLARARLTNAPITLPSVNGYTQTFPAVIDRVVLPALLASLESANRGCFAAFQAAARALDRPIAILPLELLVQSGQLSHSAGLPPSLWCLNVNTPRDLVRAEALDAVFR